MDTFLIIDGNNLLFQMFYGMPSKIYNKSGDTIHATIGFISFVLKQIKFYKEWLKATGRKNTVANLGFFIKQYKDTLNNLSRHYK